MPRLTTRARYGTGMALPQSSPSVARLLEVADGDDAAGASKYVLRDMDDGYLKNLSCRRSRKSREAGSARGQHRIESCQAQRTVVNTGEEKRR